MPIAFKVKGINEERDDEAWKEMGEEKYDMSDDEMPTKTYVCLVPTKGYGELKLPAEAYPNLEVGDLVQVTIGSKNKGQANY